MFRNALNTVLATYFSDADWIINQKKDFMSNPSLGPSNYFLRTCVQKEDIKNFRNRMNHCEPLCFNGNNVDCTYAMKIKGKLYDLLNWMEPGLIPYFQSIDNTDTPKAQIMSILN